MKPGKNRFITTLLVFVIFVSILCHPIHAGREKQDEETLNVLFIGNSYTFYHDLPQLIASLANSVNRTPVLVVDTAAISGASLRDHWENEKTLAKIKSRHWDYVVLQENSNVCLRKPGQLDEYAQKFAKVIKKNEGKILFYVTAAYRGRPQTQPAINRAYFETAGKLKAVIVPVGSAWAKALKEKPGLVLHNEDNVHPNKTGAYLTACVFYSVLYKKKPGDLPLTVKVKGKIKKPVNPSDADFLKKIAWEVVQSQ